MVVDTSGIHSSKATRFVALSDSVEQARYVDAVRAELFSKINIKTIGDLLTHIPFRYLDLRVEHSIGQAPLGEGAYVGTVHEVSVKSPRPHLKVTEVSLIDGSGVLVGVWFNQPWVARSFVQGERVVFAGQIRLNYGLKQMTQPFVEKLDQENATCNKLLPIHRVTEGISPGWMRRIIAEALDDYGDVLDSLPYRLRIKNRLFSLGRALREVHFPTDEENARRARQRLVYDELLLFELMCARKRYTETVSAQGTAQRCDGRLVKKLPEVCKLVPTDEQVAAIEDIFRDMKSSHPMNRMLLGDVGTGKTLVALYALCAAVDSGNQASMMAPTEVLARQYSIKLGPLLDVLGISWDLLTGSTSKKARQEILADSAAGKVNILFGTHALIEPSVVFANLSLVIIDEQHRFGVNQRKLLRNKGVSPDVLIMSATPIPRTLSATAYGDLATSYIRKRPIEGAGVTTKLIKHHQSYKAHDDVRRAVEEGRQAYVICALVDESDSSNAKAAMREVERLKNIEYPDLRVDVLTGKMPANEKIETMRRFADGEIDVLVSTTVVEVGIDVHNATVMIILDAERYGIAQLHQLRGRVGRGEIPGTVWLVSDSFSNEAKDRFAMLLSTNDGFKLAEFDLAQRGPGELLGVKQHGLVNFRIADLIEDADLVMLTRREAFDIVNDDPELSGPEFRLLRERVRLLEEVSKEWVSAG
ncbi:MAG: ATP-dependent DNA helicase RecG [Coriobacteriia bacterium]|nr:ATP-dependent DNA helicase RecG [Coriobacteriia bacterium]